MNPIGKAITWTIANPIESVKYGFPFGPAYGLLNTIQGGAKTMPSIAGTTYIPSNILPGGQPFAVQQAPAGFAYAWSANGQAFYRGPNGVLGVYKKDGSFKWWKPYHPIVFGRKLDAKKLAQIAKRHRKVYSELNKLFGHKTRIVKAGRR